MVETPDAIRKSSKGKIQYNYINYTITQGVKPNKMNREITRFGKAMQALRKENKISIKALADMSKIHFKTIEGWEYLGYEPTIEKYDQALNALGYELTITKKEVDNGR